jgi:hypothetical protein
VSDICFANSSAGMNQGVEEMKCWICGAEATSGEHLLKESTLKELFGEVSQQKLLYHSSARKKNKHLQSTNSELVKLRVLCAQCNSSRTQQSDLAWDTFIAYLNKIKARLICLIRLCASSRIQIFMWALEKETT